MHYSAWWEHRQLCVLGKHYLTVFWTREESVYVCIHALNLGLLSTTIVCFLHLEISPLAPPNPKKHLYWPRESNPINPTKPSARNLGVIFDSELCFNKQISSVVKNSFYQLRIISKIKHSLSYHDLVIHAFITPRLDDCNSLYLGLPQPLISRLPMVQNAAARQQSGSVSHPSLHPFTGRQYNRESILRLFSWCSEPRLTSQTFYTPTQPLGP